MSNDKPSPPRPDGDPAGDPGAHGRSHESDATAHAAELADPGSDDAPAKPAVAAPLGEPSDPRGKRISGAAKEVLDAGVSRLGSSIGSLGSGVSRLGEKSRIPVVGSGVSRLGEGIAHVGEQLHALPQVVRTRRGQLLIRSMFVGFVLVAAWIVVIVALQLHGNDAPDFRPNAERILAQLSAGAIGEVYEQASPRFQEVVRKERFTDDMTDLAQTVGKFREITSVTDSLVTTGPTGRVGRVALTVAYEKATCQVSVSLHADQSRWKLLGIAVELPPELRISQAQREDRVKACADPMDVKHCDVHQAAQAILQKLDGGHADQVWDEATRVFQKQEAKAKFVELQREHMAALGGYRRIIAVTEAKVIRGTEATFDTLAEFDRASGVRTVFGFWRPSRTQPWKLGSFKIVLPMPRAEDDEAGSAAGPSPAPPAAPSPSPESPGAASPSVPSPRPAPTARPAPVGSAGAK